MLPGVAFHGIFDPASLHRSSLVGCPVPAASLAINAYSIEELLKGNERVHICPLDNEMFFEGKSSNLKGLF